jgi:hypothetical protein
MIDASPKVRTWMGTTPKKCQLTGANITTAFIDGKTKMGPWAIMSPEAHKVNGCGLGQGRGQRYEWNDAMKAWVKTEG